jgi:PEP-CTERM motif
LDLKTGITTPLSQLIPSALQQASSYGIYPDAIDDRGDILVHETSGKQGDGVYILTPPDLAPPLPTPEPSTFLIFGLIAGAVALRTVGRKKRGHREEKTGTQRKSTVVRGRDRTAISARPEPGPCRHRRSPTVTASRPPLPAGTRPTSRLRPSAGRQADQTRAGPPGATLDRRPVRDDRRRIPLGRQID